MHTIHGVNPPAFIKAAGGGGGGGVGRIFKNLEKGVGLRKSCRGAEILKEGEFTFCSIFFNMKQVSLQEQQLLKSTISSVHFQMSSFCLFTIIHIRQMFSRMVLFNFFLK